MVDLERGTLGIGHICRRLLGSKLSGHVGALTSDKVSQCEQCQCALHVYAPLDATNLSVIVIRLLDSEELVGRASICVGWAEPLFLYTSVLHDQIIRLTLALALDRQIYYST